MPRDYHPNNIMVGEQEWVIDWMNAVSGKLVGDAERFMLLFQYGNIPDEAFRMMKLVISLSRKLLLKGYMSHYLTLYNIQFREIEEWLVPVAAARLAEMIPVQEKQTLVSMIRMKLNEQLARQKGVCLMYEYKFVSTSLGGFFTDATHQETIQEYAREGWRLVQVLPTNYVGYGKPSQYEIIFERQIHNGNNQAIDHDSTYLDAEQEEGFEHCPACSAMVKAYTRVCPSCGLTLIDGDEGDRPQS